MAKCKYPNEVCANMTVLNSVAYCDSTPCSLKDELPKQTNADRIRAMDDKELAEFLEQIVSGNRNVIGINCGNSKCESWKCTECISMWLQSEAE